MWKATAIRSHTKCFARKTGTAAEIYGTVTRFKRTGWKEENKIRKFKDSVDEEEDEGVEKVWMAKAQKTKWRKNWNRWHR
jgi:hypothetical protein